MKIKVWASVLILFLLVCTGNLAAKERRGAELLVTKTDGQQIQGELIAVRQNSILLLSSEGVDISVEIRDISVITIVKKTEVNTGILGGFLIGAIGGYFVGQGVRDVSAQEQVLITSATIIVGGTLGSIIFGLGFGAIFGKDKSIKIEGKSESEIKEILEKLRNQARIKNAQ